MVNTPKENEAYLKMQAIVYIEDYIQTTLLRILTQFLCKHQLSCDRSVDFQLKFKKYEKSIVFII